MKKIALAAAFAAAASTAFAGGLEEPVMEAEPVAESTSSAGGILVPLLALILIAAVH